MARMEGSVVINRPIDEVFAYVTDVGSWSQWNSGILEAEQTSEGPVGVGTTFQGVSQFLGQRGEWTSEVTEYESMRSSLRFVQIAFSDLGNPENASCHFQKGGD